MWVDRVSLMGWRNATAVIPPKANRKFQRAYDAEVYKWRHLVGNYCAKIKEF